jgi:hypothetical protein
LGLSKTAWRVIGALAVLVVIGIAIQTWRSGEQTREAAGEAARTGSRSGAGASKPGGLSIDELIARASQVPDVQAAIDRSKPRQVQVCGRGTVTVQPDDILPPALMRDFNARSPVLLRDLADQLTARGDAASQIAALRLRAAAEQTEHSAAFMAAIEAGTCSTEACQRERALWVAPSHVAMVQRARESTDAQAYRQALIACERRSRREPCSQLSWARFTELAPDSVEGWLFRAGELARANDAAGAQQALLRAAGATDTRSGLFDFQRITDQTHDVVHDGFDRVALSVALLDISASEPVPELQRVTEFFSAGNAKDPVRAAQCGQLARRMGEMDAFIYAMLGMRIEERLARTPEQAQALDAERQALSKALSTQAPDWQNDSFSCAGIEQARQWARGIAKYGETALARRILAEQRAKAAQAPPAAQVPQ